jgi:hypothetical protein
MLKVDPGYNRNGLLVVERIGSVGNEHIQTFKQEIGNLPGVKSSSNSTMIMAWKSLKDGSFQEKMLLIVLIVSSLRQQLKLSALRIH